MRKFNLYFLFDGEQNVIRDLTVNEAGEMVSRVLSDGGEITGIINVKDDE